MLHWKTISASCLLVATLTAAATPAAADDTVGLAAYFPFDRSAGDASGLRIFGQPVIEGGVASSEPPEYVEGRFNAALRFSGDSALRIPLDLHPEEFPQLTITAWVYLEGVGDDEDVIVATGEGHGAAIRRTGRRLEASAGSGALVAENALGPSRWSFLAGVWDFETGVARLHWRTRSVEGLIEDEELTAPEADLWVGAFNDSLAGAANGVRVDELRVYARVLDADEIAEVRQSSALKGRLTGDEEGRQGGPAVVVSPRPDLPRPGRAAIAERLARGGPGRLGSQAEVQEADQSEAEQPEEPVTFTPVTVTPVIEVQPVVLRPEIAGPQRFSALTGSSGEIVKTVDFKDRAIDSLQWNESLDKPCEIMVIDRDSERRSMVVSINQCAAKGFACEDAPCVRESIDYGEQVVRLSPNEAVTAVQVCSNRSGRRVKGIEIRGGEILPDGKISPVGGIDRDRLPNCRDDRWGTLVFCPSGHVATGVRAHFKKGRSPSANVDSLSGVELVCREVRLQQAE